MSTSVMGVEQPPASELVDSFADVVQGVRGKVVLFNRSARALERNPDLSATYTKTPEQLGEAIDHCETSKLLRGDLAALQLQQYYDARTALEAEGCEL